MTVLVHRLLIKTVQLSEIMAYKFTFYALLIITSHRTEGQAQGKLILMIFPINILNKWYRKIF